VLLLITDQQRQPRHWPDEPGWVDALMPNCAELARTGLSFTNGFCNTAMCSPSRSTLFTGRFPAEHGVELTLTAADLKPDPRNLPGVAGEMARILRRKEAPPKRVMTQFARGMFNIGASRGGEAELPTDIPILPRLLADRGYDVAYKGKWHLTHPLGGEGSMLAGWTQRDAERIERDYGFADWEAPDAGENAKASNFGGGLAGDGEGWDEVYTRQLETWLAGRDPERPFCLVASLVNPHDGRLRLYHIDLYRLDEGASAAHAVDLDELLIDEQAVIVIEWPERMGAYPLPNAVWHINISGDGDSPRLISISRRF